MNVAQNAKGTAESRPPEKQEQEGTPHRQTTKQRVEAMLREAQSRREETSTMLQAANGAKFKVVQTQLDGAVSQETQESINSARMLTRSRPPAASFSVASVSPDSTANLSVQDVMRNAQDCVAR